MRPETRNMTEITKKQLTNKISLLEAKVSELEQIDFKRKLAEKALIQRENYLSALNMSKEVLLTSDKEYAFQQFVDILGKASEASRTYIFINHTSPKGEPMMSQKAEYCSPGIKPEIDNPDLQNLKYDDFFDRWNRTLSVGDIIYGKVKDFPDDEEKFLGLQDIKAILIIPIINKNEFIGFIGFDNCVSEREWDKAEQTFLKVAANDLSQFIERCKIQTQLEAEISRFQTTMDALDAVVYVADMKTFELIYLNRLGKELTDGIIGEKCYSVLQKGQTKQCDFCTNHLIVDAKGNPTETHVWEFKNTITQKWHLLRDKAIYWPDGRLVRLEIATDISERKKMEEEILQSEKTFRDIFDTAVDAIYIQDLDGTFIDVNQGVVDMYGYKKHELIGKTPEIIGAPDMNDMKLVNDSINKAANGKPQQFEFWGRKKNGEIFPKIVRVSSGNYFGKKTIFAFAVDITNRKKQEQVLLKQNEEYATLNQEYKDINKNLTLAIEKSKESDQLKAAFLQNISHEIRTPMNSILGFMGLLKTPNLNVKEQQSFIDIVMSSSNRMLNTLRDILDISKIETGQVRVNLSSININTELEKLYNFFNPEVVNKGMILKLSTSLPSEEVHLTTDREKFCATLTKLINNSIKYSNKGSINFGYVKKENYLEFYVEDTGIGIPKERQKAIFDRFVQAELQEIKVWEGSGLGLSISKAYIEMLGGKIWLESNVGSGTKFYFTIPYITDNEALANNSATRSKKKSKNYPNKLKILIVEDTEIANKFLSIVLKKISSEILHAKTGKEAIVICQQNNDIDLVLMDIRMPEMNGYDATYEIRKFNKDVKIIAQTAYALEGDREKAIDSGCDDYISKPINVSRLMEIIDKLIT